MHIKYLLRDIVNTVHSPPDPSSFLQFSERTAAHKAEYSMGSVRSHQCPVQIGTPSTLLSHWSPVPSSPYHASPRDHSLQKGSGHRDENSSSQAE